jgi:nucleoside-diphosphate-sugar epimerase
MSKILVTGHLGWIGSNFTKLLDKHNISWVGVDKQTDFEILSRFGPFMELAEECDVIVHLAATARIPQSWKTPDEYRENNITVTDKVARYCTDNQKYLLFASSSCIYGNGFGPLNPYAWTKFAGEQVIEMYGRTKKLNYTITRIFTNYGDNDSSGLVIGKWLNAYKSGQPITIRGTGQQTRDFINVSDTAKALLAVVQQRPNQQIIDVGTGISSKLIDLAGIFGDNLVFEPELDGYASHTKADIDRTQQIINWKPEVEITSWLRSNLNK